MYMYGSQGYHICTCMVAKAGTFGSHSYVTYRTHPNKGRVRIEARFRLEAEVCWVKQLIKARC